jgi:hypothetical protein
MMHSVSYQMLKLSLPQLMKAQESTQPNSWSQPPQK